MLNQNKPKPHTKPAVYGKILRVHKNPWKPNPKTLKQTKQNSTQQNPA